MEIVLIIAYFLPILFLMAFIGHEGKKFLVWLLWGFLASIPVIILYPVVTHALPALWYPYLTVSPVLEEFFKALPIVISAVIGIKNSDRNLLACAMASGIGFSIVETWLVIDPAMLQLTLGNVMSVLARSFSTSLMHGCTTGIIGYGIVITRNFDRGALPALVFGFYTLAVTTHAMYNLLSVYYGEMGIIIDIIFPVVFFFFLLACYHVDLPGLFKKRSLAW
ncbi:MAG: PrsW family glutamic-type intramembrane protease [Methanoregula sp.]|jgi:RsiW-degrading membrane proteinase PrsW (M82 family)